MHYEDFFIELEKLPVPDNRRSTRGYGYKKTCYIFREINSLSSKKSLIL